MKRDDGPRGFTLIELLISLALLSVVVVIIVEAFWLGSRSLERGEQVMVAETRLRTVGDLISKQLRSAFPLVTQNQETGAERLHFSGDAQSVHFVTTLPFGVQKEGGLFHVRYYLEEEPSTRRIRLMVQQEPVYEHDNRPFAEDQDGILLLPDLLEADWAFSKNDAWDDTWQDDKAEELPEKVRLRLLSPDGAEGKRHEVLAALAARIDAKTEARMKKK